MAKKFYYQCNICNQSGRPKNVLSETCKCGGRYIRMPAQQTGVYGNPGIVMKKRRIKGRNPTGLS